MVKFNGYVVWPVMGRTLLQRYVMVTEVGVPDILTRNSSGFLQFLLANLVEISYI